MLNLLPSARSFVNTLLAAVLIKGLFLNMSRRKIHYFFLGLSLFLSLLMLLDGFIIPLKQYKEVVEKCYTSTQQTLRSKQDLDIVKTNVSSYVVNHNLYLELEPGDSVIVFRSVITNARQKIKSENQGVTYKIGFAVENFGAITLTIISILIIIFMFLYNKVIYKPGREKLTIFIVIVTLIIFYFHMS